MKLGAFIEQGPMNWQILQQNNGWAQIHLAGSWANEEMSDDLRVFVRIVSEDTGASVVPWQRCEALEDNRWRTTVSNIPAGGLYRIESCLTQSGSRVFEWGTRGDMIHHVGVGDLYVIAGQSNSAGYAKDSIFDPPEIGIHLLKNNGRWDLASHPMNESTGTIHESNREGGNPGHSPYLSFARQLKRALGYPIGLIAAALGGSPLSAWNPEEDGFLYRNMMDILKANGNTVKGILWYQGCSDTTEELCDTYLDRFERLVFHMRDDMKDDQLPIITVQINRLVTPSTEASDRCWGKIREAQRQAVKKLENVYIVSSTDLKLSDTIHNSSASNITIGERLAAVALQQIYGKGKIFEAPDLIEARITAQDKISLLFDHIKNRIYTFDVPEDELPFAAADDMGSLRIRKYEVKGANELELTFDRVIKGRCQVNGASEQNPKPVIPVDFASHLPMLSFYGVDVVPL